MPPARLRPTQDRCTPTRAALTETQAEGRNRIEERCGWSSGNHKVAARCRSNPASLVQRETDLLVVAQLVERLWGRDQVTVEGVEPLLTGDGLNGDEASLGSSRDPV